MSIEYFVKGLSSLKPKREDLIKLGFDNVFATSIINSYQCKRKSDIIVDIFSTNTILLLIQKYDCSNVQVGLIQFLNKIKETQEFYQIGEVEADMLVLNKITFLIEVREGILPHNMLWKCASNADNFLKAVLICAEFFSQRTKRPILSEDTLFTYEYVNKCAEVAGGNDYIDFYKMLLGYFE